MNPSRALILMTLMLVPASALAEDKLYYYSQAEPFSLQTGYRKTNGVSGFLFGHVSAADESAVRQGGQRKLVQNLNALGVKLDRAKLLPVTLSDVQQGVADRGSVTRNRLLGGTKTDTYASFKLEGKVNMGFLSSKKLNLRGFQRQEVTGAKLAVMGSANGRAVKVLGEVDGVPKGKLRLGAYTGQTAGEVGDLSLKGAVPRRMLYKLGDAVKGNLKKQGRTVKSLGNTSMATVAVLKMRNGRTKAVTISTAEMDMDRGKMLRDLKVKGVGRFFSPHFYRHKASNMVRRVKQRTARPRRAATLKVGRK